jgi:hypothetical protein
LFKNISTSKWILLFGRTFNCNLIKDMVYCRFNDQHLIIVVLLLVSCMLLDMFYNCLMICSLWFTSDDMCSCNWLCIFNLYLCNWCNSSFGCDFLLLLTNSVSTCPHPCKDLWNVNEWMNKSTTSLHYIALAWTKQKTSPHLLCILLLLRRRVHRAVP